jgi:hypothetical protein
METTLIYRKTPEGESALSGRSRLPDQRLRAVLILVDGETTMATLCSKFADKFQAGEKIERLQQLGLIEAVREPKAEVRNVSHARTSAPVEPEAPDPEGAGAADVVSAELTGPVAIKVGTPSVLENQALAPPEQTLPESPIQIASAAVETVEDIPELPAHSAQVAASVVEVLDAPELPEQAGEASFSDQGLYPEFSDFDSAAIAATPPKQESAFFRKFTSWREGRKNRPSPSPDAAAGASGKLAVAPRVDAEHKPAEPKKKRAASRKKDTAPKDERAAPRKKSPVHESRSSASGKESGAVAKKAAPRSPRRIPWIRALALVLVVAFLGLYFGVPWDKYRAQAEIRASALVGQPVHIGSMGPALFPYPHVVLSKISVGADAVARAARVRLIPSFRSVGDGRHWALDVVVENATLEKDAVGAVCAATRLNSAAARQERVRAIRFADLSLALPGTQLDGLKGEISVGAGTDSPRVALTNSADTLRVDLFSQPAGCRFTAESARWALPIGKDIALEGLSGRGSFDGTGGRLERFDARTAEGVVRGSGTLTWSQGARLDLLVEIDHLSLEKSLALVGRPAVARGELDGKLRLTAASASLQALGSELAGSGALAVGHGAIDRFNVVEAARNPGKTAVYGGAFEFERLTTDLQFGHGAASLRAISASAGALQIGGEITIGKGNEIRGGLQSSIANGARNLQVPLKVGGTLASPELSAPASRVAAAPTASNKPDDAAAGLQQ